MCMHLVQNYNLVINLLHFNGVRINQKKIKEKNIKLNKQNNKFCLFSSTFPTQHQNTSSKVDRSNYCAFFISNLPHLLVIFFYLNKSRFLREINVFLLSFFHFTGSHPCLIICLS